MDIKKRIYLYKTLTQMLLLLLLLLLFVIIIIIIIIIVAVFFVFVGFFLFFFLFVCLLLLFFCWPLHMAVPLFQSFFFFYPYEVKTTVMLSVWIWFGIRNLEYRFCPALTVTLLLRNKSNTKLNTSNYKPTSYTLCCFVLSNCLFLVSSIFSSSGWLCFAIQSIPWLLHLYLWYVLRWIDSKGSLRHFVQGRQLLWLSVCFPVRYVPSEKQEFSPRGRKFFPFEVEPFSEGR